MENYDNIYLSDEQPDPLDGETVDCGFSNMNSEQKIKYSTWGIFTNGNMDYDIENNCLKINVNNKYEGSILHFLTKYKKFKIEKIWLFNKDLICTDKDVIEEYKKIKIKWLLN